MSSDGRYTTTLHVINSAIIKLGKLTVAGKVYRGMSERLLPQWLANPNDQKVRGGVEFGFMSCSKKEGEALKYAQRGERPILLEMQMGMIDRGADFSWLSQVHVFPHLSLIIPHFSSHSLTFYHLLLPFRLLTTLSVPARGRDPLCAALRA